MQHHGEFGAESLREGVYCFASRVLLMFLPKKTGRSYWNWGGGVGVEGSLQFYAFP